MRTTPIPASFLEASKHSDQPKTLRRNEQIYAQDGQTGLTMGAIHARQAESFRNDKLALRLAGSGKA